MVISLPRSLPILSCFFILYRSTSSESRKVVKWNSEDTFTWLRKQNNASYEDYLVKLYFSYVTFHNLSDLWTLLNIYITHEVIIKLFICYCQERLAHLKRQCQPHLTEAAKTSVEGICTKIYNLSCEHVKKIHERHWQILREANVQRK